MNKQKWYNDQHVAGEDLDQVYIDAEQLTLDHIFDFHLSDTQFIVANSKYGQSSLSVLAQQYPSLTLEISGGVAYQNQERIEVETTQQYTMANVPLNLGGGLNVSRIDLIYLTINQIDKYPFSVDFIDANRNIYQQTVYTRSETTYTINQLVGIYNPAGATKPAIPPNAIALAYIHLRDLTNKIYNYDTYSLNEGFIEDARTITNIINSATITSINNSINTINSNITTLNNQVTTLNNQVSIINTQTTSMTGQIITLNNQMSITYSEILRLRSVRTVTSSTNALITDNIILCNCSAGDITVALPTSPTVFTGLSYNLKKIDSSGYKVIVQPSGGNLVDGSTNFSFDSQYKNFQIVWTGSYWTVI